MGVYILRPPPPAGILYPPLLVHPPLLEGYSQGWGVGVYKIWPRISAQVLGKLWGFTVKKGSEKGVSRRCLERPLREYDPLSVHPIRADTFAGGGGLYNV